MRIFCALVCWYAQMLFAECFVCRKCNHIRRCLPCVILCIFSLMCHLTGFVNRRLYFLFFALHTFCFTCVCVCFFFSLLSQFPRCMCVWLWNANASTQYRESNFDQCGSTKMGLLDIDLTILYLSFTHLLVLPLFMVYVPFIAIIYFNIFLWMCFWINFYRGKIFFDTKRFV